MDNMTIGPSMEVGGNTVQMTRKGKVQVTNPDGKVKTLTQDEFKKNLIKNADKINNGEEFEFKKDYSKGLRIAAAAIGTAAITAGIIYRKQIGNYLKNFSFKKLWQDIKGLFRKNKGPAGYSKQERNARHEALNETFKGFDVERGFKARAELLKKSNVTEEQLSLIQKISRLGKGQEITEEQKKLLPEGFKTKKACSEFAEKVRDVMLDGPTKVYKRKEFMPKNSEDHSKLKPYYGTREEATARKKQQDALKEKYGTIEEVRAKIAAKKEAIAEKNKK